MKNELGDFLNIVYIFTFCIRCSWHIILLEQSDKDGRCGLHKLLLQNQFAFTMQFGICSRYEFEFLKRQENSKRGRD